MNNAFTYLTVSNINLAITEAYATCTRMKYLVQNNRARAEQVDGHSRPWPCIHYAHPFTCQRVHRYTSMLRCIVAWIKSMEKHSTNGDRSVPIQFGTQFAEQCAYKYKKIALKRYCKQICSSFNYNNVLDNRVSYLVLNQGVPCAMSTRLTVTPGALPRAGPI